MTAVPPPDEPGEARAARLDRALRLQMVRLMVSMAFALGLAVGLIVGQTGGHLPPVLIAPIALAGLGGFWLWLR